MGTQTLDSIDTGNAVTTEALMEELRLVVADAGGKPCTTSRSTGEDSAALREQAAKVAGQYVHDNHWNWH